MCMVYTLYSIFLFLFMVYMIDHYLFTNAQYAIVGVYYLFNDHDHHHHEDDHHREDELDEFESIGEEVFSTKMLTVSRVFFHI